MQQSKQYAQEGNKLESFLECNSIFHKMIMDACPNKMLVKLLEITRDRLHLYRAIAIVGVKEQEEVVQEHYEILRSLQQRDK